ncbi:hypothetical protein DL96DRAFT_859838 [Flagelloscypha sp. PMI_526]|nr:hypothetical protein DL96DRAFT_859838 [Flagelloscypha sp. PMI_526]
MPSVLIRKHGQGHGAPKQAAPPIRSFCLPTLYILVSSAMSLGPSYPVANDGARPFNKDHLNFLTAGGFDIENFYDSFKKRDEPIVPIRGGITGPFSIGRFGGSFYKRYSQRLSSPSFLTLIFIGIRLLFLFKVVSLVHSQSTNTKAISIKGSFISFCPWVLWLS